MHETFNSGNFTPVRITHPPRWRYRTNWWGRLILQIQPPITATGDITRGEAEQGCRNWRDATLADVTEGMPPRIVGLIE